MRKLANISNLKILEIVNRVPFFQRFTIEERETMLCDKAQVMHYTAGTPILREGQVDTNFYVILSGFVKIEKEGTAIPIGELKAGHFLGEGCFITNRPRGVTAKAQNEVLAMMMSQDDMKCLPAHLREKLKDAIIQGMAQRIAELNKRYINLIE